MRIAERALTAGLLWLAAAILPAAAQEAPSSSPATALPALRLLAVEVEGDRVHLRADGALPEPAVQRLARPERLVIDLPGIVSRVEPRLAVGGPRIARVRVGQHARFTRVVLDAGRQPEAFATHRLRFAERGLLVLLGDPAGPAAVGAGPTEPSEAPQPAPGAGAAEPVEVYGVELERRGRTERLLVFAEKALEPRLEELDADTVLLVLPGAVLDRTAPGRVRPEVGKAVTRVDVFEPADSAGPEVRLMIRRARGLEPSLSQRGAILALEFARPDGGGVTLDFRDAELAEIVREIGAATGVSFLFDERLRGRISIAVGEELSREAALEVLDAALLVKGFAAVPTPGGPRRILPVANTASSAPWIAGEAGDGEAPVTTLVTLDAAPAERVAAVIQPPPGGGGVAIAHPATNAVILAGSEAAVSRWMGLARSLDAAAGRVLRVVRLRHASAPKLAPMLAELAEAEAGLREAHLEIWADERTNSLMLSGTRERLEEVRGWIAHLDEPAQGGGRYQVIRIRHADPESIAEIPRALAAADVAGGGATSLAGRSFQLAVDAPTRSLIVGGDAETRALVADVVRAVDRPPPQIEVEVGVMEVSLSDRLQLGFDFLIPVTSPSVDGDTFGAIVSNPTGGGLLDAASGTDFITRIGRTPLVIPIIDDMGNMIDLLIPRETFVINAEGRRVENEVLARPRLLATAGEEQRIFSGDNIPIPQSQPAGQTDTLGLQVTAQQVERQDVGVDLRVTPSVGEQGGVRLELALDLTSVGPSLAGDVEVVGPSLLERRLETVVTLEDGQVLVLGALQEPELEETVSAAPYLSKVPFLGGLFRTVRKEKTTRTLVITAQASIHRSPESLTAASIRGRLDFERSLAGVTGGASDAFAVLVTSTTSRQDAERIASELAADGDTEARVVAWSWYDVERFDVYATGFESLSEAAAASNRLRSRGWRPRVVALAEPPEAD